MNQVKTGKRKKKKKARIPKGILTIIILFLVALALLFLHNENVGLNEEVRNLQSQLDEINAQIDSKNGQLMSGADLKAVETQARALGMTEPKPEQYIYESSAKKQTVIADSPIGLYEYLLFFQQVRNENLWPQEQQ